MPQKCDTCIYSRQVQAGLDLNMIRCCAYILVHHKRRPCPPGEACTVYQADPIRRAPAEPYDEYYEEARYTGLLEED